MKVISEISQVINTRDIIGSYSNPAQFPLFEWKGLFSRKILQIISPIREQIKHERHQS